MWGIYAVPNVYVFKPVLSIAVAVILLLPCRTAVHPHLLLATEAKNNCTYAFLPEKQFGN